jgi:hypothetical protein
MISYTYPSIHAFETTPLNTYYALPYGIELEVTYLFVDSYLFRSLLPVVVRMNLVEDTHHSPASLHLVYYLLLFTPTRHTPRSVCARVEL